MRISERFESLRARGEKALITYITAGDPNADATAGLLREIDRAGADVIELGIPFSDPLADGPTIQAASQRALDGGMTVRCILDIVRATRGDVAAPIVLMTYYNPIHAYGLATFARDAAAAGVSAILISDLPPEESDPWCSEAKAAGLETVFLLAPTSTPDRIRRAAELSTGFIYCVSRTGVTGARDELSTEIESLVAQIRNVTDKPVAVGFGVSTPEHVAQVCRYADGAIVGSAIVSMIDKGADSPEMPANVGAFVQSLKAATR
jgi:tryptophan synthase alpha chain